MSDISDQDRNFLSHGDWFRYSAYPVAPLVDPDPLLRLQLELPEEEGGREGDKGQAVHRGGRGRQEVSKRSGTWTWALERKSSSLMDYENTSRILGVDALFFRDTFELSLGSKNRAFVS